MNHLLCSKGGHITVSGTGTVSSNWSRTGTGPNRNRNRRFSVRFHKTGRNRIGTAGSSAD
ncbi:hypothetical protein JCGZ_03168 [Jatropha curcas]|uniref:Uncharacterized protein n=1 Tax=Jatropha curcas TaxID=180498 RepID=A0A067KY17_JATCU|nr:hypothetical protein JCGZ_03168 [Jatropha curcas]